ncbi:hypothetical protein AMS68_007837 [Peltaster fructicola]|uniref:Antigenic cell wall galactomannoprotein n=1 Tax=Peltaster fructicola TaxID=286661 RepID=A0A6H0Y6U6_9PEZI|nr:hypothetical protein AMS68_007837 [Peltaster fructicola]
MLFKSIAAVAFLATTVIADGAAIIKSLNTIDKDIAALNATVVKFNGNLFDTFPILGATNTLNNDLDQGTTTAKKSANLTDTETFALVGPVSQLSADANITLTNLINKKADFEKLFLTGIIKLVLQDSKSKADAYSSAIIAKVPTAYKSIAQNLVAPLDAGFQKAIDTYS